MEIPSGRYALAQDATPPNCQTIHHTRQHYCADAYFDSCSQTAAKEQGPILRRNKPFRN